MKNTNNKEKKATWDSLTEAYIGFTQTYILAEQYLKNIYEKYKPLLDKNENTKKILEGTKRTLKGLSGIAGKLAISHLEENENGNLTIKNKKYSFKTGEINEENNELISYIINTLIAYANLTNSVHVLIRNSTSALVIDLEKIINDLDNEEEKEKYLTLLNDDKSELEELNKKEENGETTEQ